MLYKILKLMFIFIYSVIFPTKVTGAENVPKSGAVILASNHLSNWDPPLVGTFIPRHLAYMAKEELFHVPILKNILVNVHTFPVRRGASDRAAIKTALTMLKAGECICMFPEGTRSRDGHIGEFKGGSLKMAQKAGAPIVPVAISGTSSIFEKNGGFRITPGNVRVAFGTPFKFSELTKEQKKTISEHTRAAIQEMLDRHTESIQEEQKEL